MKARSNIYKDGLKEFNDRILVGGADYADLPSKAQYLREMIDEASEGASQEAQNIVANAQAQADEMIAAAQAQVDSIKEAARKEAYDDGFKAGSDAGLSEATAKADDIFSEMMRGTGEMLMELERARTETLAHEEERVVKFIIMLARKLIQRDLSYNPETFYEMIKQAITKLEHKVEITVYLNPSSAEKLNELKSKLIHEVPGLTTLNIIGEEKLAAGDVILESGQARQDLRIESQIDELIKTLL